MKHQSWRRIKILRCKAINREPTTCRRKDSVSIMMSHKLLRLPSNQVEILPVRVHVPTNAILSAVPSLARHWVSTGKCRNAFNLSITYCLSNSSLALSLAPSLSSLANKSRDLWIPFCPFVPRGKLKRLVIVRTQRGRNTPLIRW